MLTGTTGGAAKKPLLHIFRALVRSVLEYGMEAYFFHLLLPSKKTKYKSRSAPVYKGNEKYTSTLSSPFL